MKRIKTLIGVMWLRNIFSCNRYGDCNLAEYEVRQEVAIEFIKRDEKGMSG